MIGGGAVAVGWVLFLVLLLPVAAIDARDGGDEELRKTSWTMMVSNEDGADSVEEVVGSNKLGTLDTTGDESKREVTKLEVLALSRPHNDDVAASVKGELWTLEGDVRMEETTAERNHFKESSEANVLPLTSNQPTFFFTAGVEGSGHHSVSKFIQCFVAKTARQCLIPHNTSFKNSKAFNEGWRDIFDVMKSKSIQSPYTAYQRMKSYLQLVSAHNMKSGHSDCILTIGPSEMFSYPYDNPRDVKRHPDLLVMARLMHESGFNFRPIVVSRPPLKSVLSTSSMGRAFSMKACPKGQCVPDLLQTCILKESYVIIATQLRALESVGVPYRVLPFNDGLKEEMLPYADALERYLSSDDSDGGHVIHQCMSTSENGRKPRPAPIVTTDKRIARAEVMRERFGEEGMAEVEAVHGATIDRMGVYFFLYAYDLLVDDASRAQWPELLPELSRYTLEATS
eukprot:TRINITY_DN481_c0_g2_i2.p1 TRINITY_DN481_c0_g2~~TRINITY_DN481_c0_g2_i2.p1  ORF type:complete len:455 (-),score=63.62 TRINITY_DN481_c0_g2_i2:9-1373(-)